MYVHTMLINTYMFLEPDLSLPYIQYLEATQCECRIRCDFLLDSDSLLSCELILLDT